MNIYTHFKKQTLILIGVFLTIIISIIVYSGIKRMDGLQITQQNQVIAPSSAPTEAVSSFENQTKQSLEKIENRTPLSPTDEHVKRKILALLPPGQNSGVIVESNTMKIEYIGSPDVFQVEVLTTDITKAKLDANSFFRKVGMSQKGVCYLPLQFYLNYDISRQIGEQKKNFNPLPLGC